VPTFHANATTLFYDTAGDKGPRVLLLQGVGAVGEGWRLQIDHLATDHRVAWLDNRGIGRSDPRCGEVSIPAMASDGLALLDHLGWERAHIVGHSMGGILAQEMALRAPSRAQSLSLLSTLRRGRDVLRPSLSSMVGFVRMKLGSPRARWLAFCEMAFPRSWMRAQDPDLLLARVQASFCHDLIDSPPIMGKQLFALFRHTASDKLSALGEIPTLVLTGALDQVVPTAYSDDLAARVPGARLERLAEAGHGIILQCADEVNRLLRAHFARAESD